MARDVREVGNVILDIAERERFELSNLPFNKVIYFAHAWFLALHSRALVNSSFEAWQYGPVHPQVYRQMKRHGDQPISSRLTKIDMETGEDIIVRPKLSDIEVIHVEEMTLFYAARSASWLVDSSHEPGTPWDQVWSAAEAKPVPGMVISDELSQAYYRNKLERRA